MKPIRVLSPIKPGELCWVRVDDEWWLVRAEGEGLRGCDNCCLHGRDCFIPCESARQDIAFSRVHPIPMPTKAKVGDIVSEGESVFEVLEVDPIAIVLDRIGPPEE